jgi:hypothetical protein
LLERAMANAPLCNSPLNGKERQRLLGLVDALRGYLGSPGDWGYGTALGRLTIDMEELADRLRTGGDK